MRHKKIPTKNRKKLKSVDPFNKKGEVTRNQALKKKNWEPKTDEQPLARNLMNLKEGAKMADKKEVKKQKKHRNKILQEADRIGIQKLPFEGIQQFVKRVERTMYKELDEHKIQVTQGLAGRSQVELDEEFKKLDEKEKRQKDQKKREIDNKIKAAREERERKAKAIEEKMEARRVRQEERRKEIERLRNPPQEEEEEEEEDQADEEEDDEESEAPLGTKEVKPLKVSNKPAKRAEKLKQQKTEEAKHRRHEALLNSREIIRFGERNDAPPKFDGAFKGSMEKLQAKAGGKNLLLHSILSKETGVKTEYMADAKKRSAEEDRLQVIEAYREMKRKKRERFA